MKDLTGTLPKALILLQFMASKQQNVSFKELKNHSGLSANVLSRILKTYIEWDFFNKDPLSGRYSLGPASYSVASAIQSSRSIKEIIEPRVLALADELQESAAYFDYHEKKVTLLAKVEVANSYHYLDIMSCDIHTPHNGFFFCALAHIDAESAKEIISQDQDSFGYNSIELKESLTFIKQQGGLIRLESYNRSEITRICAPIVQAGRLRGIIGVTIISHSLTEGEKLTILKTCQIQAQIAEENLS
jgi:DNA-binding IclR family transcriptional regulator